MRVMGSSLSPPAIADPTLVCRNTVYGKENKLPFWRGTLKGILGSIKSVRPIPFLGMYPRTPGHHSVEVLVPSSCITIAAM